MKNDEFNNTVERIEYQIPYYLVKLKSFWKPSFVQTEENTQQQILDIGKQTKFWKIQRSADFLKMTQLVWMENQIATIDRNSKVQGSEGFQSHNK